MAATTDPLDRLAAAEAYLEAQEALGERLRDGFWALAKAKLRVGQAWAGPEYCREELGAARRVHQRQQQGKEGSSSSWRLVEVTEAPPPASEDEDEEPDPCPLEIMGVILSGGQNSPELREAQTHFGQALEGILRVAAAKHTVEKMG